MNTPQREDLNRWLAAHDTIGVAAFAVLLAIVILVFGGLLP